MTATTAEPPKSPLVDPVQQAKMNNQRDQRRDVIFAAIQECHDRAHGQLKHPGLQPIFTQEDIAALVPATDRMAVLDMIGFAINQGFIAFGHDPISKQDLTDRFCITPHGAGAFTAAYTKAASRLVKASKPASTSSSPAKP